MSWIPGDPAGQFYFIANSEIVVGWGISAVGIVQIKDPHAEIVCFYFATQTILSLPANASTEVEPFKEPERIA